MMDIENLLLSTRILIIDDDDYLRSVLSSQLRNEGVESISEAAKASEAFDRVDLFKPDLVLLDIEFPDGNGFDICKGLRTRGFQKPIIMLTGQQEETDIITGLEKGANGCIAKPLRFGELLALIKAQLRQYLASDDIRFMTQYVEFQPAHKTVISLETRRIVVLTEKETMILKKLFWIWPEAISKESLLSEVWGYRNMVATHTLETPIYRLRQKITRLIETPLIETTQDGYKLVKVTDGPAEKS